MSTEPRKQRDVSTCLPKRAAKWVVSRSWINAYHGEYDAGHDHEADLDVGQHGERDDKDADHGEADVAVQLVTDDLVRLPLLESS